MKLKKIVSTILAATMALSLSATAFAAGGAATDPLKQSTEIAGTTQAPTIAITVPATGAVVVNPYKMEVSPSGGTTSGDEVTDQIISATQWVENKSNVAMKVAATVTGKVEGNAKLNATTTIVDPSNTKAKPLTTNSVYLVFESVVTDDGTSAVTWSGASAATGIEKVVVAAKATTAELGTLAAGTGAAAASADGYLAFHLAGDAVDTPTIAWTANDKVAVTVAFTFTPTVETAAAP